MGRAGETKTVKERGGRGALGGLSRVWLGRFVTRVHILYGARVDGRGGRKGGGRGERRFSSVGTRCFSAAAGRADIRYTATDTPPGPRASLTEGTRTAVGRLATSAERLERVEEVWWPPGVSLGPFPPGKLLYFLPPASGSSRPWTPATPATPASTGLARAPGSARSGVCWDRG